MNKILNRYEVKYLDLTTGSFLGTVTLDRTLSSEINRDPASLFSVQVRSNRAIVKLLLKLIIYLVLNGNS